jgi:ribosomal protein S6
MMTAKNTARKCDACCSVELSFAVPSLPLFIDDSDLFRPLNSTVFMFNYFPLQYLMYRRQIQNNTCNFVIGTILPDYNTLTALMREVSLKIVNNGGIVRSIQNHGIRQLPHRFKAKYTDQDGNRYYEKGRFISIFYDANPRVMREVGGILNLDDQILRSTHLRATNKFGDVNNLRESKNPYIQQIVEDLESEGSTQK